MALSFNYRKELFVDGKGRNKKKRVLYFPKIPVILSNTGMLLEFPALVDSGSTHIFVPREIASALDLKLTNKSKAEAWTGKFTTWDSYITITLGKGSQTFRKRLPCIVPDKIKQNQEVALGRDFFKFFDITFKEKDKKLILKLTESHAFTNSFRKR